MAGTGGARPGAGRKSKADEERVRTLAVNSIVEHYGSEEQGFKALLKSQDNGLVKWVFEHAFGKPKEKVDLETPEGGFNVILKKVGS